MTIAIRPSITARLDDRLGACVDQLTALAYAAGGSPAHDFPEHVRAASAVRRAGSRLVIVQDDVNVLALRDDGGAIRPLLLPAGPGGRRVFDDSVGNKQSKMDLEACVALPDGRLVAFGSGASRARETLVVVTAGAPPRLVQAAALYAALRAQPAFAGSELNLEGAVARGDELLLFQRGNGAPRRGLRAVNAIGTLDLADFLRWLDGAGPTPRLSAVVQVDLGEVGGEMFGFTDAAATVDGRIAILACAEASPDALSDGPVLGCRFAFLDGAELRMTDIRGESGCRSDLKLEGIERRADSAREFDVVADMDRPAEAALLGRLRVNEG